MITHFTPEQEAAYHKSSWSGEGMKDCVEVLETPELVYARDTQNRALGALGFPVGAWTKALAAARCEPGNG